MRKVDTKAVMTVRPLHPKRQEATGEIDKTYSHTKSAVRDEPRFIDFGLSEVGITCFPSISP
jgi:hypothetical protein